MNRISCVELLLKRGEKINTVCEMAGGAAIHAAVALPDTRILRYLIRFEEVQKQIDERTPEEVTALMIAVYAHNVEAVNLLLELGANKHDRNKFGETAIDIARRKGFKDVVKILSNP